MGSNRSAQLLRLAVLVFAALSLANAVGADRLVTTDGRVLQVKKARENPDGGYHLVFEHGELDCPAEFIASVEIEGDMSDYVPKDDDEKKKLDDGFVRFRGRWFSKPAYQAELNKEADKRRERVEELAAHSDFYDGWKKETKHFRVQTNTSPELLDYYCELLETYYALMNKRVGIKPTPSLRRTKMKVNIYKSREEFQEIGEVPRGVVGYFSSYEESLNFYHDFEEPAKSDWVALHECTHLLTYLIDPQARAQIWINEGVADFFGSSEILRDKKGKIEIIPGKIQVDRILTVQQAIENTHGSEGLETTTEEEAEHRVAGRGFVPLEKLFRLDKSKFGAFEYAHAWSFVYYLNNHKKYEKGFKRFFKDNYTLPKGVEYKYVPYGNKAGTAKIMSWQEVRRLLLKNLGVKDSGVPKLERDWLDYIAGIEIDAPAARFKRAYRIVAGFSAGENDYEEAAADLDFAIAAGITDPRAYSARGVLRIIRSKTLSSSESEADFRKATELAPLTPRFHFQLAQQLAGSGFSTGFFTLTFSDDDGNMRLRGTDEEIDEARKHFGLAASLDPENEYYRDKLDEFLESYERHSESDG